MRNKSGLSEHERAVIAAAQVRANASLRDLARDAGLRPSVVQYTLRRLRERGILGRKKAAVSRAAIGQIDHLMYFSLTTSERKKRTQFLSGLKSSTAVSWIGELGGNYTLGATLSCRSNVEFHREWCALAGKFQEAITNRSFAIRLSLLSLNRRYLCASKTRSIELRASPTLVELDQTDDKLLLSLTTSDWDSLRDVARQTGIPLSTLARRIGRLEELGVIAGYYYLIDREPLGIETYKLMITVRSPSQTISSSLKRYTESHPRLTMYIECCGGWDYELTAEVESGSEIPLLVEDLHDHLAGGVSTIQVVPIFRYLKNSQHIAAARKRTAA